MRHGIWGSPSVPCTEKSNNTNLKSKIADLLPELKFIPTVIVACACVFVPLSCGVSVNYSMTGAATEAETISITEFYNNADLGPANMSQVFTNELKNYFVQNSSLSVVVEEGELQLEGEITDLRITPISPTATGSISANDRSSHRPDQMRALTCAPTQSQADTPIARPMAMKNIIVDDPPYEISGSGMPVVGRTPICRASGFVQLPLCCVHAAFRPDLPSLWCRCR